MVRLNLSLDVVESFEETTAFVKKGVLNLACIQGLSFKKSKEPDKFRAKQLVRVLEKHPKLKVVINFK